MNPSISLIDYLIIFLYAFFQIWIAIKLFRPKEDSAVDYFVVGRTVTLPAFVATLVSTWYGGVLGVGEYSYKYGISNWVVFGVPYYLCAFLFAIFLAKKARQSEFFTVGDQLHATYGRGVGMLGAIFVFLQTNPAPYLLILGVLCQILFGWSFITALAVGTLFSVIYIFKGGMRSVIWADALQFILMFLGFAVALVFAYFKYGGADFLKAHVPPLHFHWRGENSIQYVLVWYLIALQTLVAPAFYQRCYSAKTVRVARTGIFVSILFWLLFDFMTTFTGLYARAILPNLENALTSYPALAEVLLPGGVKGLFFVGMLATVMSTVNSFSFLSAVTIGRDLIWRWKKETHENNVTRYTQWGLVFTSGISIYLAYYFHSVVELWYQFGTISTAVLLVPLASSFSGRYRMSAAAAGISMAGSAVLSLIWRFPVFQNSAGTFWWNLEPMIPALSWSLFVFVFDQFQQKILLSKK